MPIWKAGVLPRGDTRRDVETDHNRQLVTSDLSEHMVKDRSFTPHLLTSNGHASEQHLHQHIHEVDAAQASIYRSQCRYNISKNAFCQDDRQEARAKENRVSCKRSVGRVKVDEELSSNKCSTPPCSPLIIHNINIC